MTTMLDSTQITVSFDEKEWKPMTAGWLQLSKRPDPDDCGWGIETIRGRMITQAAQEQLKPTQLSLVDVLQTHPSVRATPVEQRQVLIRQMVDWAKKI